MCSMYSVVDLCVLCFTYNENRKSILLQDNEGIVIEEKCKLILNETVNIRPAVSYICLHCLKNLNYVYKFKQMCLKNIKTFNNYVDTLETKQHLNVTQTELQYQQKIELTCNNESANEISPPIEVVLIKEEIADNFVLQDGNVIEGKEAMDKNDEFSTLENRNDNMYYSSSLNATHHIIENFLCRVKKETGFNLIPEEIQIKDECLFNATDCDSKDKSNNTLLNAGTNKPDCNSAFSEGGKNRRKDKNVNNAKRLKCDKCHKAFSYPSDLKIHSRVHTGERAFQCTTCKKRFYTSRDLDRHVRTHTGEKPYECDVCHTKFSDISRLRVHERIHLNDQPYKCSVCPKTFTRNDNLSKHMRTHTGEKLNQCQVCQYKCAESGSLKKHMRTHTGEKPYTCKHCQGAFYDSSNLKRHMRTHHTDNI